MTQIPQTECEALVALYNSTNGPAWTNKTGWLKTNTPCSWYGIVCQDGNVSRIELGGNKLSGSIPPDIGNFAKLTMLWLWNNQLSGSIPPEIGNLTTLSQLSLAGNQLSGTIPPEIGNLTALRMLYLNGNQLIGAIPSEIGNLINLRYLILWSNQLSGVIPAEIGNLTNLTWLTLSQNQLSGALPVQIGNLSALTELNLDKNQLTGPIPSEIGNLTSLRTFLDLSNNQLSGPIPPEIGNLTTLKRMYLENNQIRGPIPSEIGNLVALEELRLYNNQLSGPIPPEIGNLVALKVLYLFNNQLSGSIPPEISNLTNLPYLALANNQLSGPIPAWIGNLTWLDSIALRNNQLSGSIPPEIGNLTALRYLDLADNQLSGTIPSTLGNLTGLTVLFLQNNQLTGSLPSNIGNLKALGGLYLSNNQLTTLPTTLGTLTNLQYLNVHQNLFSGELPAYLTSLALTRFTFYDTDWCVPTTGNVPVWLSGIPELYGTGLICGGGLGSLSGAVTLSDTTPLEDVRVNLYRSLEWGQWQHLTTTHTVADGTYQFADLGQGFGIDYRVEFLAPRMMTQYYNNQSTIEAATAITITPGVPRTGIDAVLIPFDCANVIEIPQTECEALVALYESTDGLHWTDSTAWLQTPTPCSWYGISCESDNVSHLGLNNNQLNGSIPPALGNLTALKGLLLHNNQLSGELPAALIPLALTTFSFYDTDVCVPTTGDMQTWLSGIPHLYSTGYICGEALGSLSGTVTLPDATPISGVEVNLYRSALQPAWQHLTTTHTTADGTYQFTSLGQGLGIDYRVQFVDPSGELDPQYYDNKPTIDAATPITITPGMPSTDIDAVLVVLEKIYLPLVLRQP